MSQSLSLPKLNNHFRWLVRLLFYVIIMTDD